MKGFTPMRATPQSDQASLLIRILERAMKSDAGVAIRRLNCAWTAEAQQDRFFEFNAVDHRKLSARGSILDDMTPPGTATLQEATAWRERSAEKKRKAIELGETIRLLMGEEPDIRLVRQIVATGQGGNAPVFANARYLSIGHDITLCVKIETGGVSRASHVNINSDKEMPDNASAHATMRAEALLSDIADAGLRAAGVAMIANAETPDAKSARAAVAKIENNGYPMSAPIGDASVDADRDAFVRSCIGREAPPDTNEIARVIKDIDDVIRTHRLTPHRKSTPDWRCWTS